MRRLTFAEYLQIEAQNWSTIKEIDVSAKRYKHRIENPREDSTTFALGRGFHTATLEPHRFLLDYVLWEGDARRGKAWDAFKAANAHKTILKIDEYNRCVAMAQAVMATPAAMQYLTGGVAEHVVEWVDPITGLRCKARPDYVNPLAVTDLKSAKDIDPRWFGADCARYKYHGQGAFYRGGVCIATGEAEPKPFVIIAVEKEPPHEVAVYKLDPDSLAAGEDLAARLLAKVKECRDANAWPGRFDSEQTLRLPGWATGIVDEENDDDVAGLDLDFNAEAIQ